MLSADTESSRLQWLNRRAIALLRATSLPYSLVAPSSFAFSCRILRPSNQLIFRGTSGI
jgi:hypothetical protein